MEIKRVFKYHAAQNVPLGFDDAYELGLLALRGCAGDPLAQVQSIAALCALHTRATYEHPGDTAAGQIAGICAAIFDHDIGNSELGFVNPDVPYVMDNCGMGGDLVVTANISTLAALIGAAAGIPICKHGSPANADAGRHGSSDFVDLCGINRYPAKSQLELSVASTKFGFTEALDLRYKRIHMQTHSVANVPHMNDIIGPITNPVRPDKLTRRVLGVNHLIHPRVVAKAFKILNERGVTHLSHGFFVRGFTEDRTAVQGVDEVSICAAGTLVAELQDGLIREYWIGAADFNLEPVDPSAISPSNGWSKGQFSMALLEGTASGAAQSMMFANAALLFRLADQSLTLRDGYEEAKRIHASGLDHAVMERARDFLR